MGTPKKEISRRNRIYFRILALLLVFLVFAVIELILRMFSAGTDVRLFVESEIETSERYLRVNPEAGKKYFTRFEATSGTNDHFLKQKPENGYRIFVLGSSSLVGYPYDHNLMASRIMHHRLQDAYPGLKVEVINTSITAINSVTLKDYARQLWKYEPDALLIYAGHNEFYGAFGVGSRESVSRIPAIISLHLRLMNLRIYQVIRAGIAGISQRAAGGKGAAERGTLMKRIVKDERIQYQGAVYEAGIRQYRENMGYILGRAQKRGVHVFLSDLVSNIRDLPPFGTTEDPDSDPRMTFQKAVATLQRGDTLEARNLFYHAKDLDPIRFRASEELNGIIHELAEVFNATLIPARERFAEASTGGLIGNHLLTEHVHPNIEGQFLLADAFYSGFIQSGEMGEHPDPAAANMEYYRRHRGYTELDSLIGDYKIQYLKSYWPFTSLEEENLFRDTFQVSGILDSLAFSILTDPSASFQSLHLDLASYYEQGNQWDRAFSEYLALINIDPFHARYYTQAASCKLKMNDLYAAEQYLKGSLSYGLDMLAHSLLGEIALIKHNYQDAAELFNEAIRLVDMEEMEAKKRSALLRDLNDRRSEAQRLLRSPEQIPYTAYPQIVPADIDHLYRRGLFYANSDMDSALYYFYRCLEINDCPLVNYQIGNMLYMEQNQDAMHYYDKAYQGFARDANFLIRYCVSCLTNQKVSKAKEIYQIVTVLAPQHPDLPNLRQAIEQ